MARGAAALLVAALAAALAAAGAEVTITDNGYSGVVVGISKDVPQEEGQEVIDAVKVMFREGSQALFTATEKRAYFKKVTILIPTTWTNFTVDRMAFAEVYESAEVRIAPENPAYGDNPYTLQPGACGQPGKYIHLTPSYLSQLNTSSQYRFGPAGKVLTHEWAHLRYGVFEEYGYPGDEKYPLFYYSIADNGESSLVPNFCTNQPLRGYTQDMKSGASDCTFNDTTGLPDKNCMFYPYDDQTANSSLMAFAYLDSVKYFCSNKTNQLHRSEAPTKQNVRCNQKSVWEVINENADFSGGMNPPKNRKPSEIVPEFEVVQPADARFVLVLDTSGSMSPDRIKKLHTAATKWIKYELQNNTWVAIVTFTDTATTKTNFLQITDDASRDHIASFVPKTAKGGTCICNGVYRGLKLLNKAIGTGGVMILMTDGDENTNCNNPDTSRHWDLTDLYQPVIAAEVRVITMAFGTSADTKLEKFADISGGRTYFIDDKKASLDLDQAFQGCLTYQPDITVETEKNIILFQQHFGGSAIKAFSSMFSIDPTTGRDFVFKIEYDDVATKDSIQRVQLVSPSGDIFTNITYEPGEAFGTIKLAMAEEGDWQFSVSFKKSSVDMVITTTSKARSKEVLPLTTECWIGTTGQITVDQHTRLAVLGKVRQGTNSVLSATVVAHVTTPAASSRVVDMILQDGGVNADAIKDDGIYSKYFTEFNGKGRYSVVCEVRNDGHAVINEGFSASAALPKPKPGDVTTWCCGSSTPIGNTKPTGNFTRTMSAGAFQIMNNPAKGLLPPVQVTDLVMSERSHTDGLATVTWTAPGADLDQGTAAEYQFKWSNVSSDLAPAMFPSKGHEVNATLVPAPAANGTTESLTIEVPAGYTTIFLAMKTKDKEGHWSPVSNTAVLYVGAVPPPPSDDGGLSPGAIVGIVVAVVVVVGVIVGAALFQRRRRSVNCA